MMWAYLVGSIDRRSRQIVAADVYSEASPTMSLRLRPVVLASVRDESYALARLRVVAMLRTEEWRWLAPALPPRLRDEIAMSS